MSFKLPVSVLVVIYAEDTKRVLMLQRRDDPAFWQSVTGSLEAGETALQAAAREVKEEVAIDVACEQLTLIDCQRTVEFEIFSHLRHRYAPGVERNTEFWFCLALPHEPGDYFHRTSGLSLGQRDGSRCADQVVEQPAGD